jgi:hypothetical protein
MDENYLCMFIDESYLLAANNNFIQHMQMNVLHVHMCLISKRSFFRPWFYMHFLFLRSYTNSFKTDLFLVLLVNQKTFLIIIYKAKKAC